MAYFSTFFQSFRPQDHPNIQLSTAEKGKKKKKKKKEVGSGFGSGTGAGAGAGTAFGRGESEMKVPPNGNINIGPGGGVPWFWGGGEMPMSPNGMRGPGPCAPWTWSRVEVAMDPEGTGGVRCGGKQGNINTDPGVGAPFYGGKGDVKVPPSGNVNIGYGAGGVNSGEMSASINHHHGTINF